MPHLKIGIIGVGKVGETLARLLDARGYTIMAIHNRTHVKAHQLAQQINTVAFPNPIDVVNLCDLILLAVADDAIQSMAHELIRTGLENKAVVHVSGAKNLDSLQVIYENGGMIGSLHPAFPFSAVEASVKGLVGATFAIEYSSNLLRQWLLEIIHAVDGQVIEILTDKKAQYHAALAIASNYMVTLYAIAEKLLSEFSDEDRAIRGALNSLMSATMHNIVEQGIPEALTGPLVRADIGTIRSHLDALADKPMIYNTYVNLAKLSYPMLMSRGIDISEVDKLLRQDRSHASDDT